MTTAIAGVMAECPECGEHVIVPVTITATIEHGFLYADSEADTGPLWRHWWDYHTDDAA